MSESGNNFILTEIEHSKYKFNQNISDGNVT